MKLGFAAVRQTKFFSVSPAAIGGGSIGRHGRTVAALDTLARERASSGPLLLSGIESARHACSRPGAFIARCLRGNKDLRRMARHG